MLKNEYLTVLLHQFKELLNNSILLSLIVFLLAGCANDTAADKRGVHIVKKNGRSFLVKDGKYITLKGAGGFEHLDVLAASGGNAIRIWDTIGIDSILNEAKKYKLSVLVGLPMPKSGELSFYNNEQETTKQFNAFKKFVDKYKNHPSVLMWCVGNELGFPYDLKHNNFYRQFNRIVKMIHHTDPNHPVTTSTNVLRVIPSIKIATNIDVLSFNLFGNINSFREDAKWLLKFWNAPFMITEWAVDGPWVGTQITAWGAYIEPSSTTKADLYLTRYNTAIPKEDPNFLGSFVFYWGNKQETTHTWFSMFDDQGGKTEAVAIARFLWSGKRPAIEFPKINYMSLNNKTTFDNILTKSGSKATAQLFLQKPDPNVTKVMWQIYAEDWHTKNLKDYARKKPALASFTLPADSLKFSFTTPVKEGPYRLFATVFDRYGNIAIANTPFYVLKDK